MKIILEGKKEDLLGFVESLLQHKEFAPVKLVDDLKYRLMGVKKHRECVDRFPVKLKVSK